MAKQQKARTAKPAPTTDAKVSITLTVAPLKPDVYLSDHVDVHLNHDQRIALRRIYDGLHDQAAKLANGRYIQTNGDVVRHILEQVYAGLSTH